MTKEYLKIFVLMFVILFDFIAARTAKDKTWSNVWYIFVISYTIQLLYCIFKLEI